VGAGPGDPGLMTLRGLRRLRAADVVLYDALAPTCLLREAPSGALAVYVGKKRTRHSYSQEEINGMMIRHAREGKRVVRLKGGDPYIFGRGGEEAEALAAAGVAFEVIPGVTSACGVAAYAGIPLTHRDYTSAATFVTGHSAAHVDWRRYAGEDTLVIFMGLTVFAEIAQRLIEAGRSPSTPAAAVRWGTRGDQATVTGTLENLARRTAEAGLKPPALIIAGEVVNLRERLDWFEALPLFGARVIVTRAADQAAALTEPLRELGATPLELPVIETRRPPDSGPLERAVARLASYDWVLFTSVNGVRYFFESLDQGPNDVRALRAKICAIGPATARELRKRSLKVDLMPEQYVAESVLRAFEGHSVDGQSVLLPRAAAARDLIPAGLERRGARVDVVAAYETVLPEAAAGQAAEVFGGERRPDWVTFTSSSTVNNLLAVCSKEQLEGVRVAAIGPVTSETARRAGLAVEVDASEYTIEGLVEALAAAHRKPREAVPAS